VLVHQHRVLVHQHLNASFVKISKSALKRAKKWHA
jgi:hypothetical protein